MEVGPREFPHFFFFFDAQLFKELFFSSGPIIQIKENLVPAFVCQDKQAQSFSLHFWDMLPILLNFQK